MKEPKEAMQVLNIDPKRNSSGNNRRDGIGRRSE